MGYSVDISEHGNTLITTAKTQRRMFTSDWDYVTMDDVHIYIYEKDSFGLYFTLEQIILVHSQNEEIDMPVSLHFADNSFIAGLPWLSYSTFKGHAYVYERCIDSGLYVRAGDLTGAENLNYDDSFGAAVALSGNHAFVGNFNKCSFR